MLKFIFILISFFSFLNIRAQQVTNIQVIQESDKVVITYDISSNNAGQTFDIKVECSADNGKTFLIKPKSLSGDLKGISAGTDKRIVWDVLSERQELAGDHFVFQLVAEVNNHPNNITSKTGNINKAQEEQIDKSIANKTDSFHDTETGSFTDARDGQDYKWVKIGTQVWMAENLNAIKYRNGDPIQNVINNAEWAGLASGAYCNYANDINIAKTYGRLYNWYAVNDIRNLAPRGWHVATDAEWTTLVNFLGGESIAGGKLRENGISHWGISDSWATNKSGFTGLPGGIRNYYDGLFGNLGSMGDWWSSSEASKYRAWRRHIYVEGSVVWRDGYEKNHGFSVRCVKD